MAGIVKHDSQDLTNSQEPSMLQAVMAAAMNPDLDPERIEKFLNMARDLEQEKRKQEFNVAFATAYNTISQIKILKNGEIVYPGKQGKPDSVIKFIKHEDLSRAIKPVLAENGLTATYSAEMVTNPPKTVMVMTIIHSNGYSREWRSIPMPIVDSGGGKSDMQGAGSVSTYGRRYVIIPAFDIVAEGADDDGNLGKAAQCITEGQVAEIMVILDSMPAKQTTFMNWINQQFKVDQVSELRQGPQFDEVMAKLEAAQRQAKK